VIRFDYFNRLSLYIERKYVSVKKNISFFLRHTRFFFYKKPSEGPSS